MEHQMDYKFSRVVDPSTYETHDLCDGIPLRCHFQPELEEIDTLRCQENWREWVGPLGFYKGGLGPRWNFMAITIPECLPERLGVLGYANELAFLHDDCTDIAALEVSHNKDLMIAFKQGAETGQIENATSGKRAIQAYIAREMLALNKEQAMTTMQAWAKFAELGSGREHTTRFKTETEYIKYRMVDIGTMFWYGMVTFGMGISIPEDELDLAHELADVAYLNLGLTNDLYSYQKEYETAMAMGEDHVVNVIWVLREEHNITEDAAKELCKQKIKQTIVDFRKTVRETNARTDVSTDTKRYLEGLLYSLSGNLVWSIECPRYHRHCSFNDRQLDWMKNGIPKEAIANTKGMAPQGMNGAAKPTNGRHDSMLPLSLETVNGSDQKESSIQPPDQATHDGLVNVFANHYQDTNGLTKLTDDNLNVHPNATPNGTNHIHTTLLDEKAVQAPYDYVSSLPSKGFRERAIDALNVWFKVPTAKLDRIKRITHLLHNASLLLDDLEDGSHLRRGHPSTHTIFGVGQTINSANYSILRASEEVQGFGDAKSQQIYTEELKGLFVGQSWDLYWTSNLICPSVEQYFQMVECKTGGLFKLFGRLMELHSSAPLTGDLYGLLGDFGRYFQARDDYQNLVSSTYAEQKGYCEDLDEGKFSLPLIHLRSSVPVGDLLLQNMLTQRRVNNQSSLAHKQTILAMMKKSGSLDYTVDILNALHTKLSNSVEELDRTFGVQNFELKLVLEMLKI